MTETRLEQPPVILEGDIALRQTALHLAIRATGSRNSAAEVLVVANAFHLFMTEGILPAITYSEMTVVQLTEPPEGMKNVFNRYGVLVATSES